MRLLFATSRLVMSSDDRRAAMDAIDRGVDWNRIVEVAEFHGCLPLVHRHISAGAIPRPAVPEAIVERLDRGASAIARRNLLLTSELATIVREFDAHGIAVLPLKGPVLAQSVYGSVALRRIRDLDILCSRDQVGGALDRLVARGYDATEPSLIRHLDRLHTSHHLALRSADRRIRIELHFRLCSPFFSAPMELPSIAHRLVRVSLADTELLALCPEDLLVYLCVHGSGHGWERLEWLCAVAELLRSNAVRDWDRVARWADELGVRRLVISGAELATTLLGAPVSYGSLGTDHRASRLASRVQSRLMHDPLSGERPIDLARAALQTDATIRARLARVWQAFVVPRANDMMAVPLPAALWPLYYIIRPLRLSSRFLFAARIRRSPRQVAVTRQRPATNA